MRNPEPLLDVPNACRGLNLDNRNVELLLFMNLSLLIARLLFNHLNKTGV